MTILRISPTYTRIPFPRIHLATSWGPAFDLREEYNPSLLLLLIRRPLNEYVALFFTPTTISWEKCGERKPEHACYLWAPLARKSGGERKPEGATLALFLVGRTGQDGTTTTTLGESSSVREESRRLLRTGKARLLGDHSLFFFSFLKCHGGAWCLNGAASTLRNVSCL